MTTVRIWFTKTGEASYISLLDLQRVMQRSIKRSGIPVWYTMGFNPHIYMTFANPLPLGQESLVESVDVKTELEQVPLEDWRQALDRVMPLGIKVTRVTLPQYKAEKISFARYQLRMPLSAQASVDAYNQLETAVIQKKTKRGHKEIDLKQALPRIETEQKKNELQAELLLTAGEGNNLNPSLWLNFMQEHCGLNPTDVSVLRTALLLEDQTDFR
nr:TIGR03936 family radical SAM-associated protein [Fournierella massiliensis]